MGLDTSYNNIISSSPYTMYIVMTSRTVLPYTQVSYRILGRGYFSVSLFAGNKCTEIEGRGSHLK